MMREIFVTEQIAYDIFGIVMRHQDGGRQENIKKYLLKVGIILPHGWTVTDVGSELSRPGRWFLRAYSKTVSPQKFRGKQSQVQIAG
jgi:hypothetical protein